MQPTARIETPGGLPLNFALKDSLIEVVAIGTMRIPGPVLLKCFLAAMAPPGARVPSPDAAPQLAY